MLCVVYLYIIALILARNKGLSPYIRYMDLLPAKAAQGNPLEQLGSGDTSDPVQGTSGSGCIQGLGLKKMTAEKFINFLGIVKRLRDPDGCPWDRKQTPQTFRKYLLEEAHELLEAINEDHPQHIKEELGDLLFQIIFLCSLYAEQKLFSLDEVIDGISDKMIRRHPHVFGDKTFDSESEMRRNWQAIKNEEKKEKGQNDNLVESIPKSLPALRYTQRVLDRLSRATVPVLDPLQAVEKFEALAARLRESVTGEVPGKNDELFGDLFFLLAFLGRISGTDAEEALKKRVQTTVSRFARLEQGMKIEKNAGGILSDEEAAELLFGGPEPGNGAPKKV